MTEAVLQKPADQLIQRAQTHKEEYSKVYLHYYSKVYNYLWFRVGRNRHLAEDLMQETFLHAFEHLPRYTFRGYSYLTYLITIARNLLTNHFRRPAALPLEEAWYLASNTSGGAERNMLVNSVWQKALRLTPSERTALELKYKNDYSVATIARKMGKSENAVKLLLSRSRKKVRDDFQKELRRDQAYVPATWSWTATT